jgi:hypothetical protein
METTSLHVGHFYEGRRNIEEAWHENPKKCGVCSDELLWDLLQGLGVKSRCGKW